MTRRLLDTDTLSYYLKGDPKVVERAAAYLGTFGKLDFTIITYYEIRRGLLYAGATRKLADFETLVDISNLWGFDRQSAQEASDICADLWRRGEILDDADILISAIARKNRLILVTNNIQHFSRVPRMEIENWKE